MNVEEAIAGWVGAIAAQEAQVLLTSWGVPFPALAPWGYLGTESPHNWKWVWDYRTMWMT